MKAFMYIDTLEDKNKFSPWICKITINVCNDMLRKKITDRYNNISLYNEDGDSRDYINELSETQLPDSIYENKELRNELKTCINSLPKDERLIIILKLVYGLSYIEIAEKININENTVKTKTRRAKLKIIKKLERYLSLEESKKNG